MMKNWQRHLLFLFILSVPVMACSFLTDALTSDDSPTSEVQPSLGAVQEKSAAPDIQEPSPQAVEDVASIEDAASAKKPEVKEPDTVVEEILDWPPSIAPIEPFARPVETADEEATFDLLAAAQLPERDDIEMARLYEGWQGVITTDTQMSGQLEIGTVEQLNVLNHDAITIEPIAAELLAVSDHAYFWFDTGPGSFRPSEKDLIQTGQEFDLIYEQSIDLFGPENNPGVDGDPRLHIVNASPFALCNTSQQCGLAGYYSASDGLPVVVDPKSNAREMFVMNVDYFGSAFYVNVLTHELRHMIEDNYDSGDADWEVEGAAMLAEDLLGFTDNAVLRANIFLERPDQQLNNWTDGDTTPYYGQGYLLNRYIYQRLGQDLYGQFAASQENGLQAIDAIAQANNLDLTGEEIWLDWLAAMALHDQDESSEKFQFGVGGLDTVTMVKVDRFPEVFNETVQQYAADYYYLDGDNDVTLNFEGNSLTHLMETVPASGRWMWAANRANYSHASLTRPVDLSGVDEATLNYQVYYDIEAGYDFAYLFVSEDDGQSWQPLAGNNMEGVEDDPSESALAGRFYTGRSEHWLDEKIDLTPYAGKEILIRFAYVTDPILTKGGIAIDNIAIPEIAYYDDVETSGDGWTGRGFERVTATIPQQWHLQLITFPDGIPQVESLPLSSEQTVLRQVELPASDDEAILIVAASAPMTLETAYYRLGFAE